MASEPSSGSLPPAGISGTQSAAEGSIAVNAPQPIRWRSAGKDHGVDAVYRNGENAFLYAMIEANGGGPGILDYDRDGDLDLFFPGGGELTKAPQVVPLEHQIYRNRGDGFFERLVDQAGSTASRCYSFGVNVGDYDQDGFAD
ncbi:MAG: FG-GAP repeat domain-containing protein, partial [Pirellulaceae bacterium]